MERLYMAHPWQLVNPHMAITVANFGAKDTVDRNGVPGYHVQVPDSGDYGTSSPDVGHGIIFLGISDSQAFFQHPNGSASGRLFYFLACTRPLHAFLSLLLSMLHCVVSFSSPSMFLHRSRTLYA